MSLLDRYYRNHSFSGHVLGFIRIQFGDLTQGESRLLFVGFLAANATLLLLGAWFFQIFWAWFIPVAIPMLPHVIPYWHAFAVTVLMVLFAPKPR